MKKNTHLLLILIGLSSLLISPRLNAQHHPPKNPEIREYIENRILPAIMESRKEFEATLSASEKEEINQWREKVKLQKESSRLPKELLQKARNQPETLTDAEKVQLFDSKLAKKEFQKTVHQALEKHIEKAKPYLETLLKKREEWRNDLKNLNEERLAPENNGEETPFKKSHHLKRLLSTFHFVLMDPANPFPFRNKSEIAVIFPNPSNGNATITYQIEKATSVSIEIVDQNGNSVKEVLKESKQMAGNHTVSFSSGNLKPGHYFCIVQTDGKKEVKRFIVK